MSKSLDEITELWHQILRVIGLILFAVFCTVQYLNHTGFCYAEKKHLTERELVGRFLFGDKAASMTDEEKIKSEERRGILGNSDGKDYYHCCRIYEDSGFYTESEHSIMRFFGYYIWGISYKFVRKSQDEYQYESGFGTINACGKNSYILGTEYITKDKYDRAIANNKEYYWSKR